MPVGMAITELNKYPDGRYGGYFPMKTVSYLVSGVLVYVGLTYA